MQPFVTLALIFLLPLFSFAQQKSVAVLPSDGTLKQEELELLTDKMRETALEVLPANAFILLKQDVVIKRLGGAENYIKECKESSCIVDLGKKAQVDYVAQASVGKLGENFRLKVELYDVKTEGLLGAYNEIYADYMPLISDIDTKVLEVFKKIPGVLSAAKTVPAVVGGISGLENSAGYVLDYDNRFLVNVITEPRGAALSFNGLPMNSCKETPCRVELPEGEVRIITSLERYQTADTTISITRNNQNINIKLKSNFGFLNIEPAYSNYIGNDEEWNLILNGKKAPLGEIRLSPGNYEVKLTHSCYEDISFKVGINKGSREVFDLANYMKLKRGGLELSAERNGELVSEPVFINEKHVGKTPFSSTVPLCAIVEIGYDWENVNVALRHNESVKYTHKMAEENTSYQYDAIDENIVGGENKMKTSSLVAIGFDMVGAVFLALASTANSEAKSAHSDYKVMRQGTKADFDRAWDKVNSAKEKRDTFAIIGTIALGLGIGIHIAF